jgi:hypothetical protein
MRPLIRVGLAIVTALVALTLAGCPSGSSNCQQSSTASCGSGVDAPGY